MFVCLSVKWTDLQYSLFEGAGGGGGEGGEGGGTLSKQYDTRDVYKKANAACRMLSAGTVLHDN